MMLPLLATLRGRPITQEAGGMGRLGTLARAAESQARYDARAGRILLEAAGSRGGCDEVLHVR
jgi:hypothetical protein